ncbi:hypothetical protein AGLY_006061, partial [Aphis glycines]
GIKNHKFIIEITIVITNDRRSNKLEPFRTITRKIIIIISAIAVRIKELRLPMYTVCLPLFGNFVSKNCMYSNSEMKIKLNKMNRSVNSRPIKNLGLQWMNSTWLKIELYLYRICLDEFEEVYKTFIHSWLILLTSHSLLVYTGDPIRKVQLWESNGHLAILVLFSPYLLVKRSQTKNSSVHSYIEKYL